MRASTDLVEIIQPQQSTALAVLDQAVAPLSAPLRLGTSVNESLIYDIQEKIHHYKGAVPLAMKVREKWLPRFAEIDEAYGALARDGMYRQSLGRKTATQMLAALLDALGAKAEDHLAALDAMLDMLMAGDEVAIDTGLWHPVNATAAMLSLACRKLIVSSKFVPKPAELYEACREAAAAMDRAKRGAEKLRTYILKADAVLLVFDRAEWRKPYQTPAFQPIVNRVLTLHGFLYDEDSAESLCRADQQAFEQAIHEEQIRAAEQQQQPPRLAACAGKPAKRTRKQRKGK